MNALKKIRVMCSVVLELKRIWLRTGLNNLKKKLCGNFAYDSFYEFSKLIHFPRFFKNYQQPMLKSLYSFILSEYGRAN